MYVGDGRGQNMNGYPTPAFRNLFPKFRIFYFSLMIGRVFAYLKPCRRFFQARAWIVRSPNSIVL